MRLLLDECVPRRLTTELHGHHVKTVRDMGWEGIKNGALLRLAVDHFDALLTVDQGIEHQQNLSGLTIGVVIMLASSMTLMTCAPWCRLCWTFLGGYGMEKSCEWVDNYRVLPMPRLASYRSGITD